MTDDFEDKKNKLAKMVDEEIFYRDFYRNLFSDLSDPTKDNLVTLGRSDAILAAEIISCYIEENRIHLADMEDDEPQNLLDFILVQLNSMANND